MNRGPHRRIESQTPVAVDLVANLDGRKYQGNRSGCEHVMLPDLGSPHERVKPQALRNSNARRGIDEDEYEQIATGIFAENPYSLKLLNIPR